MLTTFYPPYHFGGDATFVRLLSIELAHRGHHVEVVHCADSYRLLAGREPDEPAAETHPNLKVHSLRSRFGFLSPLATQQLGTPLLKSSCIQRILSGGFDVIHYHNVSLIGGPKLLTYGRAIKLYTAHEYWLVCPTHTLFKFNREPCVTRSCLACSLAHLRPPQLWRYTGLRDSTLKYVDRLITPSRFGRDIHQQMGLNIPLVHLPPFVPQAETPPAAARGESPYFLFVGRLEKIKGIQTLIPKYRTKV